MERPRKRFNRVFGSGGSQVQILSSRLKGFDQRFYPSPGPADPSPELAQRSVTLRFEGVVMQPRTLQPAPEPFQSMIKEWARSLRAENKSERTIRCYTDAARGQLSPARQRVLAGLLTELGTLLREHVDLTTEPIGTGYAARS
jgi:hypothetical protein